MPSYQLVHSNSPRKPLEFIEETLELFNLSLQEVLHLLSLFNHGIRRLVINLVFADDLCIV